MMIYIINKLIIAFLILLVVPIGAYAISSEWSCSYGDPPFGDIEISYTNKDAINKAEIYAINPQKHPVIYPGGELALQLNSELIGEQALIKSPAATTVTSENTRKLMVELQLMQRID